MYLSIGDIFIEFLDFFFSGRNLSIVKVFLWCFAFCFSFCFSGGVGQKFVFARPLA